MMIILIQLCMLSIFLKLIRRSSNIWGVGQRLFRSQMATASCVTHSSSFFRNSTRWNFFQQTKTCCMFFDKPKLIESFLTNQNWLKVFCQIKTRWKFFEKLKLVEIFSTKPKTCWKFSKKAKFVESFLTNQNSLKVFRQIKTRWKFFLTKQNLFLPCRAAFGRGEGGPAAESSGLDSFHQNIHFHIGDKTIYFGDVDMEDDNCDDNDDIDDNWQ